MPLSFSAGTSGSEIMVGISNGASDSYDIGVDSPHLVEDAVLNAFFPRPEWKAALGERFRGDIRGQLPQDFRFVVESSEYPVVIVWNGRLLPDDVTAFLVDRLSGKEVDMKSEGKYVFSPSPEIASVSWDFGVRVAYAVSVPEEEPAGAEPDNIPASTAAALPATEPEGISAQAEPAVEARDALSLIILPFRDDTGGGSYRWLSVALQNMLSVNAAHVKTLKELPIGKYLPIARKTPGELGLFAKNSALALGRKLSVEQVWMGGFKKAGPNVEVEVWGLDVKSGREVFRKKTKAAPSRLLAAGDNLFREILKALGTEPGTETLKDIMSAKTDSPEAWRLNAAGLEEMLLFEGKKGAHHLDKSVSLLRQALKADPEYAEAWVNLGRALLGKKDNQGARAAFENALRLKP